MGFTIAVLPGDGIGPEVTAEAERVLRAAGQRFGIQFTLSDFPVGAAAVVTGAVLSMLTAVLLAMVELPALSLTEAVANRPLPSPEMVLFDGQLPARPDSASAHAQATVTFDGSICHSISRLDTPWKSAATPWQSRHRSRCVAVAPAWSTASSPSR